MLGFVEVRVKKEGDGDARGQAPTAVYDMVRFSECSETW